jgi:carboxypeptidase C (cathepsin A)
VNGDGPTGQLHYWMILSENDPANDPVTLWLNGGPGSSSLVGLLTENGQFQLNDASLVNSTGNAAPELLYNEYGWTRKSTVIWLEQPKGVGFSYCTEGTPCVNTDETTAEEAYDGLIALFKKFPELQPNDFFITGESYAGICWWCECSL